MSRLRIAIGGALAAAAPVTRSLSFDGAPVAHADADPNANCVGQRASRFNGPDQEGQGGQGIAATAHLDGGVAEYASTNCGKPRAG